MKNIKINEVLSKEMSRTEFLGLIGAGLLSMIGVTALVKNLGDVFGKINNKQNSFNYGNDNYGGSSNKSKLGF